VPKFGTLNVYGHLFKLDDRTAAIMEKALTEGAHRDSIAPRLARYGMVIRPYSLGVRQALPYACAGKGYQIDGFYRHEA
jgi:hypothetical protein